MNIKHFFQSVSRGGKMLMGKATKDVTYSSQNTFPDRDTAVSAFKRSKAKLFDVNRWSDLSALTAKFELYDNRGTRSNAKMPQLGYFIRILLPAPSPENWVKVTDMQESEEMAAFTVSPCNDPNDKDDDIDHFFIKEATSTFKVELIKNSIRASEIGKNEGINNQGKEAGERGVLNTLIAVGGWAAFQELQWKKLTAYLVHKDEIEDNVNAV